MASYKPYIKKSNDGTVDELPLDATTLGGIGANGFARASHTHTKSEVGLGNVDNTADANKNVKYATTAGSANSVAWTNVSNKPSTFPPDNHNHDDRYYTESEIDSKLNGKANSSHTHSYLPLSGGALTGALNFNNNTWNLVGDDVYIGDYNQGGSLGIKGKNGQTNIGFVNQSNDYYIKLASPGVTENRTITMPNDSGTMALTKNIPTSLPASDVYDWAKASTKPSYSWSEINNKPSTFPPDSHTHSYLPLDGSKAMTGTLTLPENSKGLRFRDNTSYEVGTFYGTTGNEALTFYTTSNSTSFQFINGSVPGSSDSWTTLTPALQIRNNKVIINKHLGNGVSSNYNLEVNGSMCVSGTLDLSSSANGIRFGNDYNVTNIEAGSTSFNVSNYSGATGTITVSFHNYNKGYGNWYVVANAYDPGGTDPSGLTVAISSIGPSGCTIKVRRNTSASGNPAVGIYYVAIKYSS